MITEGTKVVILSGDRDIVLFSPLATVHNIKPDGSCEIHHSPDMHFANVSEIAETMEEYEAAQAEAAPYASPKSMVVYDWKAYGDHPFKAWRRNGH
jgi:hypothetical protein